MLSPQLLLVISRYQVLVVALAGLVTLFAWPEATPGLVAGGLIMAANFWLMHQALNRLLDASASRRTKLIYGLFLVLKFFLVMGALAVLVVVLRLHPMGIALGLLSLFAAIVLGVFHRSLRGAEGT
jgi:hypothetical protein